MDIGTEIIVYGTYLAILAALIAALHMGFRTPQWQRRELLRRAVGDGAVLVLFGLIVLVAGAADWQTWLMLVGGFVIAAVVKIAFSYYDAQRLAALRREDDDDDAVTDF